MSTVKMRRIKENMGRHDLDALIVSSPINTYYSSGYHLQRLSPQDIKGRPCFCVIPRDGDPVLVIREAERSKAETGSQVQEIRSYVEFETSPISVLANVLEEKGLSKKKIGIEKLSMLVYYFEELKHAIPDASFTSADQIFKQMRMIKSKEEIELLEKAAKSTEKALLTTFKEIQAGQTEKEVAENMACILLHSGADEVLFSNFAVWSGDDIHFAADATRRICKGNMLRAGLGGRFSGYYTDVARMTVLGEPSKQHLKFYNKLVEAYNGINQSVTVSTKTADLYESSIRIFKKTGIPFTMNMIGHGIGLDLHEPPLINSSGNEELKEGMIICVEPFSFLAGIGACNFENTLLITKDGPRNLTNLIDVKEPFFID